MKQRPRPRSQTQTSGNGWRAGRCCRVLDRPRQYLPKNRSAESGVRRRPGAPCPHCGRRRRRHRSLATRGPLATPGWSTHRPRYGCSRRPQHGSGRCDRYRHATGTDRRSRNRPPRARPTLGDREKSPPRVPAAQTASPGRSAPSQRSADSAKPTPPIGDLESSEGAVSLALSYTRVIWVMGSR
jgi:hypothetical protein